MIDLYSVPTANGQRVHIMLEETGLPYTAHFVDLYSGAHMKDDYLAKNPFGRVPALVDNDGPGGRPVTVFEGHAILYYLAEKSGKFYPDDLAIRAQIHTWMSAISSNLAPAFSAQFWFTTLAPERSQVALDRYLSEIHRGLKALDLHLSHTPYVAGEDYTIADIFTYPVAATSAARLEDGLTAYPHISQWVGRVAERPAVARGMALFADKH